MLRRYDLVEREESLTSRGRNNPPAPKMQKGKFRMKHFLVRAFAALSIVCLFSCAVYAGEKTEYTSVKDAFNASTKLIGKSGPASLNWIDDGARYSYTTTNDSTDRQEIRSFDPSTGKDQLIFDGERVTFPGTSEPFAYRSFEWAHDSKHIVFETNFRKIYRKSGESDYYVYSLADKTLKIAAKNARTAELSPGGSMVGYERRGNMFVYNFATKTETRLTNNTAKDVFNGHFDWVYEEEFGQPQAWSWSPDSRYIAYWHFDESPVPIIQISNYEGLHNKWVKIPVPQVGDSNAIVKVGVLDVRTHKNVWLNPGLEGDYYIPRIYWTSEPNTLAMITLNRAQNNLRMFFFNVVTGARRMVLEERSRTWISIFNFYTDVNNMMFFPKRVHEFFWMSDRSGYYQIYRYDYDGKLINRVTRGDWDVIRIVGIDPGKKIIYYTSAEASPLQVQLYSIRFDGSGEKRLSEAPGFHQFNMSPDCRYYIDTYSNVTTPMQVELWNTDGRMMEKLENNASVSKYISTHAYSPKELFSFTTTDSVRLDCSMIKPFNFDSTKKYPVILTIYGGPESHYVYDSFESTWWKEWLAQQGYILVNVNNRGCANYGRAFMKVVYRKLGYWESHDFVQTARYLAILPYVEADKMAIMGKSYGGYSTVYTMLTHPGVFKVGIANSPVTDWRLYDDIYTERYMGLLSTNEAGYVKSDCMTYADSLKGKLLIVHSEMDDNVHPINTMQLLTALTNAGKDADLRIFPPGAHGAVYNNASRILLYRIYTQYLNLYLKGDCSDLNLNR